MAHQQPEWLLFFFYYKMIASMGGMTSQDAMGGEVGF